MLDATERIDTGKESSEIPEERIGSLTDFSGGMVTAIDPLKLADNQYYFLKNGRVRYGNVSPVKIPEDNTRFCPTGLFQGLYSARETLILFVAGVAYYKRLNTSQEYFQPSQGFIAMDSSVDTIYAELVPESFNNFTRISDGVSQPPVLSDIKNNSDAVLVCQDGINRPRLMLSNSRTRVAQNFDDWTQDNPEYVPIGKQMIYKDGTLYVVSGNEIFRSVEGRPLDFVIAIDSQGNKLTEYMKGKEEGSRLSIRVGYSLITSLFSLNVPPLDASLGAPFLVTSDNYSWMVMPRYDSLVYGEPRFRNVNLFPTGALNQFSVVNVLGDTVFVDSSGLKSFNAISQFTSEGRNSPFSKNIHSIFQGIQQTSSAAIVSDNYVYFGMRTIYGNAIVVYDELTQSFVGLDIFDNIEGNIKQFAEVLVNGARRVFFITDANKLYELNASTAPALCEIYTKEWASGDIQIEQLPKRVNLSFINVKSPGGAVELTEYVDRKKGSVRTKNVLGGEVSTEDITETPFGESATETTETVTFKLDDAKRGYKVGLKIRFQFEGELNQVELLSKLISRKVSRREIARG